LSPERVLITGSPIRVPIIGVSIASLEAPQAQEQRSASATPNPVKETEREPVSTFSTDVDTASYAMCAATSPTATCRRCRPCASKR
jgi:hypothetical protein